MLAESLRRVERHVARGVPTPMPLMMRRVEIGVAAEHLPLGHDPAGNADAGALTRTVPVGGEGAVGVRVRALFFVIWNSAPLSERLPLKQLVLGADLEALVRFRREGWSCRSSR